MARVGFGLVCIVVGQGCGPKDPGVQPPAVTVEVQPAGERVPLSHRLLVRSDEPVTVVASWGGTTVDFGVMDTTHALPLHGFRPSSTTPVTVRLATADGAESVHDLEVQTGPLPDLFPRLQLLVHQPEKMQPGYTLLSVRPGQARASVSDEAFLFAVDDEGEVVWLLQQHEPILDAILLDDGTLLAQVIDLTGPASLVATYDLEGNPLKLWHGVHSELNGVVVQVPAFHHEARTTSAGTLLSLSKQTAEGLYPVSYADPDELEYHQISADVAVEFDHDGNVLHRWDMADYLDFERIGYGGLESNSFEGDLDWTHGNALVEDPSDGSVLVSLRNQSAVLKLRRTGELVWILGNHDNWSPDLQPWLLTPTHPELTWFYVQHAPNPSGDGRVVLFDNGGERTMPFTGVEPLPEEERFSRVVEYVIDEQAMTVTQTWEYVETTTGRLYSTFVGDADYLQNGNVLSCFGYVVAVDGVPLAEVGVGERAVRLIEFAPGEPHDTVWDLRIFTTPGDNEHGVNAYRAERIPSLYPHLVR